MKRWRVWGLAFLLPTVLVVAGLRGEDSSPGISTMDLELQVTALTAIDDLDLTSKQMRELKGMVSDTPAHSPAASQANLDIGYHDALKALRDALATGDDDKIGDAEDKVDDVREKLDIDPYGVEFTATAAAKSKAAAALKMLSTSQLANYISMHSDDIPDALDTIMDAVDQCKDGSDDDFSSLRNEAASQVAMLAGGADQTAGSDIGKQVSDLLDHAHQMKQPSKHHDELEKQAREITKSIDSFDAMRHWMLREMSDMLSNPQITNALSLRAKSGTSQKKPTEE